MATSVKSPRIEADHQSRRDARQVKGEVAIDMNPMVDLAFLLLTFFMLAASFSRPQTMEIVMPPKPQPGEEAREQPIKESKALTIVLGAEDRIWWYRGVTDPVVEATDYSPAGVHEILLRANAEVPDLVVLIKPTAASTYRNLVDILDEMNLTSTRRYAVVDASPEDLALIDAASNR